MLEINFLSQQNLKLTAQQQKDRVVFKYSLIAFIVFASIFSVAFSVNLYLRYRFNRVQAQVTAAKKQIDSERTLEANYLFFVNKLLIIRELFDQRAEKQIAIGFFTDLFGPEVTISGLNYIMEEGILSLQVTSPHVFILETAFSALENPEVQAQFKSLSKTNLNRLPTGEYVFTLTVSFVEESEAITIEEEY